MNEAHWHLLFNHAPIFGCLIGLGLLGVGLVRARPELLHAGLVLVLLAAGLCIPTQLTGEGAEAVLARQPGWQPAVVHAHEEAAELAFWVLEATGALALLALLLPARRRNLAALTALAALLSLGVLGRAAYLGGAIRHPEIHS